MRWYFIVLIIVGALLILFFLILLGIAGYLVHLLSYPKRYDRPYCLQCDLDKKVIPESVEDWEKEEWDIPMKDGTLIHGDLYLQDKRKFILFAHGYTWTREGSLKYALLYHQLGYSCYLYDERSHGDNEHHDVTLGYRESEDLHEIVQAFRKRFGEDVQIGLHGESMGGAIVILEMKHTEDHLAFVIADSPFASMKQLMKYHAKLHHAPPLVIPFCDLFLKLNHHYTMKQVEPREGLSKVDTPLLLIQGDSDTFIPPIHTKEIEEAKGQNVERHLFPGVDHTDSYHQYPEEYEKAEMEFLKKYNLI